MDFDGIKDFVESVGDTVAVFGNEEAIRLYDEIKEIIDDWSSCDSDDITRKNSGSQNPMSEPRAIPRKRRGLQATALKGRAFRGA